MTAREQFSWAWLIILAATYVPYFAAVVWLRQGAAEPSYPTQIWLFGVTAVAQVVLIAIASAVIALRTGDPNVLDERDRSIAHRAAATAYSVLIAGIITVGCLMPFNRSGWDIFHAAVFAIALAEGVRLVMVVHAYRRGLHA